MDIVKLAAWIIVGYVGLHLLYLVGAFLFMGICILIEYMDKLIKSICK